MVCITNLFNFINKIMNSTTAGDAAFDEKQSLKTIQASIKTSKRILKDDGLLLICWGLVFSVSNFWNYYKSVKLTSWWMRNFMDGFQILAGIAVVGLTLWFIFIKRKKATTFTAISTRYVWIGVILAHNMIIIITKIILEEINFTLLQPLQLVLIGFALFVTGGIYRYYLLAVSGVVMWIAAIWCAHYELPTQHLIRSVAEFICFVIPGLFMYFSWKK